MKFGERKTRTIDGWEQKWKMCFMKCGFSKLLDIDFDTLLGCPSDLLHDSDILLGIFGEQMVKAAVHMIQKALGRREPPKYWETGP